jgi:hypothetical protein
MSLDQLLTPEHLSLLTRLLEVRDGNGRLVISAEDMALRIVKGLVTDEGRLSGGTKAKLEGDPSFGRAQLISALASALVGSEPVAEAWIEAAAGGFAAFKPVTYAGAGKTKGSPGVYLQRMLADYRNAANTPGSSSSTSLAKRSELSILIVTLLIRELKKATASKLALGPAWSVMMAVDRLPKSDQRRIDALANNESFRVAIGEAVAGVLKDFASKAVAERTNTDIKTNLPATTNIDVFFADREQARLDLVKEGIALFESASNNIADIPANETNHLLNKMVQKVNYRWIDEDIADAVAYLNFDWKLADAQTHERQLKRAMLLMPSLDPSCSPRHRLRRLLPWGRSMTGLPQISGVERADWVACTLIQRIKLYARDKGPPPPDTPLEHYSFFEIAACFYSLQPPELWLARERWGPLGDTALGRDPQADELINAVAKGDISVFDVD